MIEVMTQAEIDAAVASGEHDVIVVRGGGGWLRVSSDSATVDAYDSATVRASGSATVHAYDSATVRAYDSATVRASDSATVWASGSVTVWASGSATVDAYDSATVDAYDSATVDAYGSATVRASDSVTVWAYDSATVRASDSVTVRASDSVTVRASGSATVRASGSATVRAGALVAIHNHNPDNKYGTVTITGGVVIDVRKPATIHEWFDRYGVTPYDGVVTLFKAVADDYESSRGFRYVPGTIPVAPDWDGGKAECGGGLHFCAAPWIAKSRFKPDATRFVACPILVTDIAFHPDGNLPEKVKARGCCAPVWECDIDTSGLVKAIMTPSQRPQRGCRTVCQTTVSQLSEEDS